MLKHYHSSGSQLYLGKTHICIKVRSKYQLRKMYETTCSIFYNEDSISFYSMKVDPLFGCHSQSFLQQFVFMRWHIYLLQYHLHYSIEIDQFSKKIKIFLECQIRHRRSKSKQNVLSTHFTYLFSQRFRQKLFNKRS